MLGSAWRVFAVVLIAASIAALTPASGFAQNFIVKVTVGQGQETREFSGVAVAENRIVTSTKALGLSSPDKVTITSITGGVGKATSVQPAGEITFITVPLTLTPAELAIASPLTNDVAQVAFDTGRGPRIVPGTYVDKTIATLASDARLTGRAFGGALMNACGQLTAIVVPFEMSDSTVLARTTVGGTTAARAVNWIGVDMGRLASTAAQNGVQLRIAELPCAAPALGTEPPSPAAGADTGTVITEEDVDQQLAQLEADRKRQQEEIQALQAKRSLSAAEKQRLAERQAELDATTKLLNEAKANAEKLSAEKAAADAKNKKQRQTMLIGAIGGGALLLIGGVIAFFLLSKANKTSSELRKDKDALSEAERRRSTAPDWVLTGQAGRLKLRGPLLADESRGAVVGRGQSEADVLVDMERVSRRHARFFLKGDQMFLEDLRSLNGTTLNGRRLSAGEITEVRPGDRIEFADQSYTLARA